jgi:hypothetical protein
LAYNNLVVNVKADDAAIGKQSLVWDTAHDAATGTLDTGELVCVVSKDEPVLNEYNIVRSFAVYDTTSLPDTCKVMSATFYFYPTYHVDELDTVQSLMIIQDSTTYPHDPPVTGDYELGNYTLTNLGSMHLDDMTDDTYNSITLNSYGIAAINKAAVTKFAFVLSYDYIDNAPGAYSTAQVSFDSDAGGNPTYLSIDYVSQPTVTSSAASSVSFTTATANGNITNLGYDAHADYRGCVYGTSDAGDPGNVSPPSSGWGGYTVEGLGEYGTGAFTCSLSSLDQDQTYYYRTYCMTIWGYTYSSTAQNFHTLQLCSITTSAASSVMNTTARLPGNVTDAGYPTSVTVTVFWGPDDKGNTTEWPYSSLPDSYPGGVAAFYKDISGLSPGDTYYFNARGNNTSGDVWAGSRSFVTQNTPPTVSSSAATSVTDVGATLNGSIDSCGGDPTCGDYGFVWGTGSLADPGNFDPTLAGYTYNWKAGSSHGTGAISHAPTLSARTVYYFRACAYNNAGWDYSDTEQSFTTCDCPDVTTVAASTPTLTSIYFNMTLDSIWGSAVTTWGFEYATDAYYTGHGSTYDQDVQSAGPIGLGAHSLSVSALTPGTKYHFRAYATNAYGTGYGADLHFGTLPEDPSNLLLGAISYTSIDMSWTKGAHAAQTKVCYETGGTTGAFPATPYDGTEAYFNTGSSCTIGSLIPGETYYIAGWSWIEGSDVWSSGYVSVVVTLSVPPPVSLKAVADDSATINIWWIVPVSMRSVATVTTLIYGHVGAYPADPPDPPGAGDVEVYNEVTGDEGVKDYTWTGASAGTPYFFSVWFYDSSTDNYTTAVSALCTTPAGYDDPDFPGGSGDFDTPDDTSMSGVPLNDLVHEIADVMGMQHGLFWGLLLIGLAVLLTMGAVIYIKSGLIATGVGGVILAIGISQGIVNGWVLVAFVFLGLVLSWVSSHIYGS